MLNSRFMRKLIVVCCLLTFIFSAAGCEPLRKKFVRKKKKDKDEMQAFIPVLEPEEYAVKVYTPEERYRQHYSLWRAWNDEFLSTVQEMESDRQGRSSDKKQKYLLGQIISQLQEMSPWVQAAQQQELQAIRDVLNALLARYEKPPEMRNMSAIRKDVETNAKKVRLQLNPDILLKQKAYKE